MEKKLFQLLYIYIYIFFKDLKSSRSSPRIREAGKMAVIKIIFIFRIVYIFHILFFIFVFVFCSSSFLFLPRFYPAFFSIVFFLLCLLFASIEICQSIKNYVVSLNLNVSYK